MKKKYEVLFYIDKLSTQKNQNNPSKMLFSTKELASYLNIQRSNLSAILNELVRENKLEKINFKKMDKILEEIDDIKLFFQEDIFIKVFSDAVQSYIVHQELEFAKIAVRPVKTLIEKQVKQIDWLYAHKFWLFSLAGGMDATLEVAKRATKQWMKLPAKYNQ